MDDGDDRRQYQHAQCSNRTAHSMWANHTLLGLVQWHRKLILSPFLLQFEPWLFHFRSGSHLWLKCLGPFTHVEDLEEAPGSQLRINPALVTATTWKMNQRIEHFSSTPLPVFASKSVFPGRFPWITLLHYYASSTSTLHTPLVSPLTQSLGINAKNASYSVYVWRGKVPTVILTHSVPCLACLSAERMETL